MTTADTMNDIGVISGYHIHVYYHDVATKSKANSMRKAMLLKFPSAGVNISVLRDQAIPMGIHQRSMFIVDFPTVGFANIVPWVMLNQNGLNIMIHPTTGNDKADHQDFPMWLGSVLPINFGSLE